MPSSVTSSPSRLRLKDGSACSKCGLPKALQILIYDYDYIMAPQRGRPYGANLIGSMGKKILFLNEFSYGVWGECEYGVGGAYMGLGSAPLSGPS